MISEFYLHFWSSNLFQSKDYSGEDYFGSTRQATRILERWMWLCMTDADYPTTLNILSFSHWFETCCLSITWFLRTSTIVTEVIKRKHELYFMWVYIEPIAACTRQCSRDSGWAGVFLWSARSLCSLHQ